MSFVDFPDPAIPEAEHVIEDISAQPEQFYIGTAGDEFELLDSTGRPLARRGTREEVETELMILDLAAQEGPKELAKAIELL